MVLKFCAINYDGCEFYIDTIELTTLTINYVLFYFNHIPEFKLMIMEYDLLTEYDEPIDLFNKYNVLLESYNLGGLFYYLNIGEQSEFTLEVCKKILKTFRLLLDYAIVSNNTSIKEDIENNINILSHAVKSKTCIELI